MIAGYAGKLLEVDLSSKKTREVKLSREVLIDYIGGRALATKILWDRLGSRWETVDPLKPENLLLLLTGPLTGFYPGGRICVSGKSPQSNGVVGSTIGGEFGVELKCAGYDAIIVAGRSEKPVYLFVKDSEAEILDASHIWGKDGKQTVALLTKECRGLLNYRFKSYGEWREPAIVYIGPAGENKVRTAIVAAKWTHAAGYGGYGAVMGSKNLKAIAVKGTGPLPKVSNMTKIETLVKVVCRNAYGNELWRRWGTGAGGYENAAISSSEPIRNWQEEWHDEKSFAVNRFEERAWVKQSWSDFGCPTACMKVAVLRSGKYKGSITDSPDYELQAYLGPNLGIFTPEENIFLSSLVDDLGLCGIQTGNVLGFAAELFQRGILSKKDLDGIELEWGNAEAFATLARKIASREGVGDLLAEGTYRAALRIGEMKKTDILPYAIHCKGIGIGAHGIRSGKDFPQIIAYACSVQGGDHSSTAGTPINTSGELMEIFDDSAVRCKFNGWGLPPDFQFRFYRAVTGMQLAREKWCQRALKTLHLQRAMLLLGGPDVKWKPGTDDDNPSRFYEPLPSGPFKGKTVERAAVIDSAKGYYKAVGWDEKGIPTTDSLRRLGLIDVEKKLEKLRY